MAVKGHYNHYDDPDEFWDDEPIVRKRPDRAPTVFPPQPPTVPRPAASVPEPSRRSSGSSLIGVGLFTMSLDEGHLPIDVDVSRNIHDRLNPSDLSTAAMTGYFVALWRHDAPIITSGRWTELTVSPSRRIELITLLSTRSLAEFEMVERSLRLSDEFVGRGPVTDFGMPSIMMSASISRIGSIEIDPRWGATASPSYIAHDILDCANQIRQQRPRFHESGIWAHRTDDELEHELAEYKSYLMRTS
ncbi:hypothetical protein [Nocardia sp. R7R-8]|uniref:hypothetical protein n=1 Tax=Nocardia sp. R7R-8 TaxID=3459304 RepID=UPI00403D9DC6